MSLPHITVCICTYKRPVLLERLLEKVAEQESDGTFTFSLVVADNDAERSAEEIVGRFAVRHPVQSVYCCEATRNIALVRNMAVEHAPGDFIAFIDDDEYPCSDWLKQLFLTCQKGDVAGVLGPVRPHFEQPPPDWIVKGRLCDRPEYPTGTVLDWGDCRTGNVLFRRNIIPKGTLPFEERFDNGGEDVDFFMRMVALRHRFVWCNEAVVHEHVPPARMTRGYMLRRSLLRGRNRLKMSKGRVLLLLKSILAVPLYSLVLPVAFFLGQDHFMNYCIRLCDHLGHVLAVIGLNRMNERQM